jgi:hypothetical protein
VESSLHDISRRLTDIILGPKSIERNHSPDSPIPSIAWGATQAVKQNVKINPRKEMEKLSQEEKSLVILSEKGKQT